MAPKTHTLTKITTKTNTLNCVLFTYNKIQLSMTTNHMTTNHMTTNQRHY